ncbi:unnamed protein product [Porites lobata]|uniref:Uncharacterized protein n=1 Tax=Porites lobata TaxID=104759 RepID=A0ABN8S8R2_9CNID|nr:unnamed protein product [Porites lobata]
MGWFERKDGCKYDDQSEDGKKTMQETKPLHLNTNGHPKNYESSTDARRLMRQVREDQEQVNWTEKASQSKQNSNRSQSQSNGKESSRKQSECYYCGATPSHPNEKCRAFLLKYKYCVNNQHPCSGGPAEHVSSRG